MCTKTTHKAINRINQLSTSKTQNNQAFKGPYNPHNIKTPNFCLFKHYCWVACLFFSSSWNDGNKVNLCFTASLCISGGCLQKVDSCKNWHQLSSRGRPSRSTWGVSWGQLYITALHHSYQRQKRLQICCHGT